MSTSNSSTSKLLTTLSKALVALLAALCAVSHGQFVKIMFLFFFLASTITKLFRPTFTEVLMTAKETHLSHVILFFIKAVSIAVKIPTATEEVEGHIS